MVYSHSHNLWLSAVAVVIAIVASYSALELANRVTAARGRRRLSWRLGSAFVMGSGIWSMHFTAMMAFSLPIPILYDIRIVVISWFAAMAACYAAFHVASQDEISNKNTVIGALCLAIGIGVMHYVGMAGMVTAATLSYSLLYFALSILVAIVTSIAAIWLFIEFREEDQEKFSWIKLLSAVIMGGAVSLTHFTGMHAAIFTPTLTVVAEALWHLDITIIGTVGIIASTLVVLGFSLFIAVVDQRLSKQTIQLEQYVHEITELNEKLHQENQRLGTEVEITRRLQQMILPREEELEAIRGLDISGYMEPAEEVGGDYYDVLSQGNSVKIGIGDVTDHGLESGVIMLMTQTAVRTLLNSGETDPIRFLDILNRTVYGNVQRMKTDRNLSLSLLDYAETSTQSGKVRLSGQHEEMIVIRSNGALEIIDTADLGLPIGLDADISQFFNHTTIELQSGDGVVLFTDGITEAENVNGEQFGMERLCKAARRIWFDSADAVRDAIIGDLRHYIGEQVIFDDITLLVAKQR